MIWHTLWVPTCTENAESMVASWTLLWTIIFVIFNKIAKVSLLVFPLGIFATFTAPCINDISAIRYAVKLRSPQYWHCSYLLNRIRLWGIFRLMSNAVVKKGIKPSIQSMSCSSLYNRTLLCSVMVAPLQKMQYILTNSSIFHIMQSIQRWLLCQFEILKRPLN